MFRRAFSFARREDVVYFAHARVRREGWAVGVEDVRVRWVLVVFVLGERGGEEAAVDACAGFGQAGVGDGREGEFAGRVRGEVGLEEGFPRRFGGGCRVGGRVGHFGGGSGGVGGG